MLAVFLFFKKQNLPVALTGVLPQHLWLCASQVLPNPARSQRGWVEQKSWPEKGVWLPILNFSTSPEHKRTCNFACIVFNLTRNSLFRGRDSTVSLLSLLLSFLIQHLHIRTISRQTRSLQQEVLSISLILKRTNIHTHTHHHFCSFAISPSFSRVLSLSLALSRFFALAISLILFLYFSFSFLCRLRLLSRLSLSHALSPSPSLSSTSLTQSLSHSHILCDLHRRKEQEREREREPGREQEREREREWKRESARGGFELSSSGTCYKHTHARTQDSQSIRCLRRQSHGPRVSTSVYVCICICLCLCLRVHAYMYSYMYISVYIHTYTYIYTLIYANRIAGLHRNVYVDTCRYMHLHLHLSILLNFHIHIHMQT